MSWTFRTMIVSDSVVDTCRSLAQLLAGEGQVLWTTPLSADGAEPATHWISSGLIDESFADLLPLYEWTQPDPEESPELWVLTAISLGNPVLLSELSGGSITEEQAISIFTECVVTLDDPKISMSRIGVQMVRPLDADNF